MEAVISIAGSILGSLASKAVEYTVDPIAQQLSYLFKHRSKFQNLRTKVDHLKDARERVQQSVIDANRNGKGIFGDVDRWLTEVNGKISEQAATPLQEDEEKAKKRCFAGFCPNFKSRYQLSKKAEKEAKAIAELLGQKNEFDRVSYPPVLDPRPAIKEYEAFESRSGALNGVSEALKDDNCNIIGVYGMGGVGKTTLVKEVFRQAKEKQLFDEVVFVAVTQTPNTENIQNEIAEKLGLKYDVESIDMRAAQLRNRLKKDKKILIILDDIWVTLNLDALGIPSRDEHKGCKILMTSRKLDVLQSMDSQKNIPIDILKEVEAWNLFKNIAGDIVERSNLQSIAIKISKKCAGLPIAITTVAKALKHKENLFEWKNALRELRRPSERNFKRIPADAYSAIELSYKFLEVEEHRPIFLLCSIMGHNAAIEDLLRYGMGLGLFRDVYTMEETRDRVLTLVSNLKASCLLLDGSNHEHFDMHDVVRDVAISIASRDHHWLALRKEDVFEEWSDEETMRNYNLISLQYAKVSELLDHDQLGCPNLTFFSLSSEDSSLKIPDNFFLGMERLKVLDFTKMHFSSLPLSMGLLKNIHTLCLFQCMLEDIVVIGELKNLEILNLRKSDIAMLPREIGQLTKLKLLDLSDCRYLEVIVPNVLSSLSRLEELYLYDSFDRWEVVENDNPRSNASLVELQYLSRLTTLELHIPNEQAMPKGKLFFRKMERYKISIGDKWLTSDRSETSRMLKLKINNSIHLYDEVKPLLRNTEYLYLNEGGIQSNASLLFDQKVVFPAIKVLYLDSINVVELWHDQFSVKSFGVGNLTSLEVWNCHNLKYLFPSSMVQSFDQLKILVVSYCNEIEEVIGGILGEEEMISSSMMVFPKLHYLRLYNLSKLKRFCSGSNQIQFPFLKELEIGACPVLSTFHYDSTSVEKNSSILMDHNLRTDVSISHYLFNQKVVFPTLKQLRLHSISSIEKLWHDQVPIMSFSIQKLTNLEVWGCCKLKYVFTSSMIKSLVQLRRLFVEGCDEMEEVIEGILEEEMISSISVFPELYYLYLYMLPNLKRFCSGIYPIQFPFLTELTIRECPVLSTFYCDSISVGKNSSISMDYNLRTNVPIPHYLFNEKVLFPIIEELTLHLISGIEKLWYDQLPIMSFKVQNLTSLEVRHCHNLKYVFTSSMIKYLVQLKTLVVSNCDEIEEVIAVTEGILEENTTSIMVFPKLHYMNLKNLPNLKRFFSGINPIEFPFLRELTVWECPVLSTFYCDCTSVEKSSIISMDRNLRFNVSVPHYLFNQKVVFCAIEDLQLNSISSIGKLWHDELPSFGVQNLTSLKVRRCYKLKYVFTSSMVKSLVQLKTLVVEDCHEMEEIIEGILGEEEEEERISTIMLFPKLDYLKLRRCRNLKRFCSGIHPIELPLLSELRIEECPSLSTFNETRKSKDHNLRTDPPQYHLFNEEVSLPMLEHLQINYTKNLEGLWSNQLAEDSLPKLISFDLGYCDKLRHVFPLSMLTRLQKLDKLTIRNCELLEEIFESQQEGSSVIQSLSPQPIQSVMESVSPKIFEFPRVTSLRLKSLPKLKSFYYKIHATNWPSLKEMEVIECDKLEILFASQESSEKGQHEIPIQKPLFWVKTAVPTIEESILYLNNIERLWHDQLPVMSCGVKNLISLEVHHCHNLKNLFTFTIVRSFVQLKKLVVEDCEEIEEVIAEERIKKMVFPKLDYLELKRLPSLKRFCSGNPIEFPFLKVLKIASCPVFTTFHCDSSRSGNSSSSISMKNTNIPKYLFNEKVALPMLKELYVSDMENLQGLWPDHHDVGFQRPTLTDSGKVKEIIEGGGDKDEVKHEISFPQLNRSEFIELPKLESSHSLENYTFRFPSLKFVIVQDCPKMKKFSQGESNTQILQKVRLK